MSLDIEEYKKNHKTAYLASEYERLGNLIAETRVLAESDALMRDMADGELKELEERQKVIIEQMEAILNVREEDEVTAKGVVLEVRAGAGGDEAGLFAHQLADMYMRYAGFKGWEWRVLDESKNEAGGYKEASFELKGKGVYEALKNFK